MDRFNKYFASEQIASRVFWALIFGMIFAIIGRVVPDTYYRYLDPVHYLHIDSPVNVDRNFFKPCDKVVLTSSLYALTDVQVVILNQLVLVKDDGTEYQLPDSLIELRVPIRKSEPHTVSYPFPLPCNLEDGRYFWKGTVTYEYNYIEKTIGFISQTFNVSRRGLSPELETIIIEDEHPN